MAPEGTTRGAAPHAEPVDLVLVGASGGIGQYLVEAYAGQHRIYGTYCSEAPPEDLHPGVEYLRLDLRERESVPAFCESLAPRLTRPVLVYTPGVSPNATLARLGDADWDEALEVNLTGAMRVVRGFLPRMRELGFGRVVLLSSVLSRTMVPGTAAYSVSKAGLNALARVVAAENATKGVTANTLALGYHDVGIIRAVPKAFLESNVLPTIPQGRLGDPAGIRNAIDFLIASDYVTGATLDINGGIVGA